MEQMAETVWPQLCNLLGGCLAFFIQRNMLPTGHIIMLVLPGQHISKSNPQRKPQTKSKYWIGHIALYSHFDSIRTVLRSIRAQRSLIPATKYQNETQSKILAQINHHARKYRKARGLSISISVPHLHRNRVT